MKPTSPPNVSHKVCGGGKLPDDAIRQFLELAGGERARLIVVPIASQRADENDLERFGTIWRERGFPTVAVVHTRDRKIADYDNHALMRLWRRIQATSASESTKGRD